MGPSTAAHIDRGDGLADGRASVIVCTFSSQRLEQTIACVQSVLAQRPPPQQVIVVVDHNEDLRATLRARMPAQVEIVANAGAPGLSSARNTALGLTTGDPIVFIDDDAVAHEQWLARLLRAFDDPTVFGVGGHSRPAWEHRQPAWFPDEFLWIVGCSFTGQAESGAVRNPIGVNMAFRAEVFDRVGLFDPGIGRLGSRPLGCEETELCIRLARLLPGARLVLVAGADIDHWVPRDRMRLSYVLRRCYYEGISKALVRRLGDRRSLDPERTYVRRTLPSGLGHSVRIAVTGPARTAALGRIAAVIGGLTAAVAGYAFGTVAFRVRPPAMSSLPGGSRHDRVRGAAGPHSCGTR